MHKYLRAIGFSNMNTIDKINKLAGFARESADEVSYVSLDYDDNLMWAEYNFFLSDHFGICVSGEYDEANHFYLESLMPFFRGNQSSASGFVSMDRLADKEGYYGVYDDLRSGVAVIFRLQNVVSYLKTRSKRNYPEEKLPISLAGLSIEGKVLLPLSKTKKEDEEGRRKWRERLRWIAVAKVGCNKAMEFVTLNDMNTASNVEKQLKRKKDIFTIVDSTLYPYGLESDHYAIVGDIREKYKVRNIFTGETVWMLTLEVNELIFDICINAKDLEGEPMVGRRFKGIIWLQGTVHFPE